MTTTVAVGTESGHVVLRFPEPVTWASLEPEQARQVAEAMARAAYELHHGRAPAPGHSPIANSIRTRLVRRLAIVLRDLLDRGKSVDYIARQAVDIVMAEVI